MVDNVDRGIKGNRSLMFPYLLNMMDTPLRGGAIDQTNKGVHMQELKLERGTTVRLTLLDMLFVIRLQDYRIETTPAGFDITLYMQSGGDLETNVIM